MENMSPAPSIPAKRIITALSVSVISPRKPQQDDSVVLISALLRISGVGASHGASFILSCIVFIP